MRSLAGVARRLLLALFLTFSTASVALAEPVGPAAPNLPAVPATSNTIPDPSAWQVVITGQIEAFRRGDGQTALSYAGVTFRRNFTDPNVFMLSVAAAGYTPIFTSVSHSFGKFTQPDIMTAVQVVDFIGPRQEIYQAIYALSKEPDGWRIEGVQLMQENAISV